MSVLDYFDKQKCSTESYPQYKVTINKNNTFNQYLNIQKRAFESKH